MEQPFQLCCVWPMGSVPRRMQLVHFSLKKKVPENQSGVLVSILVSLLVVSCYNVTEIS